MEIAAGGLGASRRGRKDYGRGPRSLPAGPGKIKEPESNLKEGPERLRPGAAVYVLVRMVRNLKRLPLEQELSYQRGWRRTGKIASRTGIIILDGGGFGRGQESVKERFGWGPSNSRRNKVVIRLWNGWKDYGRDGEEPEIILRPGAGIT